MLFLQLFTLAVATVSLNSSTGRGRLVALTLVALVLCFLMPLWSALLCWESCLEELRLARLWYLLP